MVQENMKDYIRELFVDSCCGEEWGENIGFHHVYQRAVMIYTYLQAKKKVSINYLEETEVDRILRLEVPVTKMKWQGIDFLRGWKNLVDCLGKEQKQAADPVQCPELFLVCLKKVLTIKVYEKLTEYPEAEWILEQDSFLEKMAGFVWFWEAVNYKGQEELDCSIQNGLSFLFGGQGLPDSAKWIATRENQEKKEYSQQEYFIEMFGKVCLQKAETFEKICAFTEEGVDEMILGRVMLERVITRELEQTDVEI